MSDEMCKLKVGMIGCGNISDHYLRNFSEGFDSVELVACADMLIARAQAKATAYSGVKAVTVEALLADPEIDIVLNLTIPAAHYDVAKAALKAGKSVYNEKPLTRKPAEARELLALAEAKGLRVGCAPDTFLGEGLQTCVKVMEDDVIGKPVAATAFVVCHGHETWHPDPEFFYKPGGGPMFDMGPYYLTALVALMGPVRRVTGSTRINFPVRTITSEPKKGESIKVEVPTHVTGVLDFECGAVATIIASFDIWHASLPCIEIYGTKGTLRAPDPNGFGGKVEVCLAGEKDWREIPSVHGGRTNGRGLGVADMAEAIGENRPHRASGKLAAHVLDVTQAFQTASDTGRHIEFAETCRRPAPLTAPQGVQECTRDGE